MEKGRIVVTGVTGRQGGAVARRLLADGWAVRGLTRDPSRVKARRMRAEGVEIVQGDMADRHSLRAAFEGAHGVFSVQNPMTSGYEMEVVQGKNVADAALAAGVEHLVYASAGATPEKTGIRQWDNKLEIEGHIRRLGLPFTVLKPVAFMELMSDKGFYPSVSAWHVMPKLMGWDRTVVWVSVADLGVIAASAFARRDDFAGRELPIAGDAKSLGECRALWQEVAGRAPRRFPMPVPLFERFVDADLCRMWRWLRDNPIEADLETGRAIHPGMRTVKQWIAGEHEQRHPSRAS
ncbi:MAG: NmrA/HSCARG family protein [Actinomycetota bacterium]|nr:NmrA/HSCARG family protein [Actinomycetota bacterium]